MDLVLISRQFPDLVNAFVVKDPKKVSFQGGAAFKKAGADFFDGGKDGIGVYVEGVFLGEGIFTDAFPDKIDESVKQMFFCFSSVRIVLPEFFDYIQVVRYR